MCYKDEIGITSVRSSSTGLMTIIYYNCVSCHTHTFTYILHFYGWVLEKLPNGGTTLELVLPELQLILASCAFIKKLIQKMEVLTIFCLANETNEKAKLYIPVNVLFFMLGYTYLPRDSVAPF